MTGPSVLNPNPREFERFLHAPVGEDRNGTLVTVLSMLARLGLDPWNETAELIVLKREAAVARLEILLSRFRDIPRLGQDHGSLAQELFGLLPEPPPLRSLARSGSTEGKTPWLSGNVVATVVAIVLILMQIFLSGGPGPGE